MGSHGWIFATEQSTLWRGAGPVDGHPDLISPYKAELGGLVALLHLTLMICSFYNLSGGQIVLYCDCLSAIKRLQQVTYGGIKDYTIPDFDLLHEGRLLLKKLRASQNITVSWVKGHFTGAKKSTEHKLNDMVHDLAKDFLRKDQGYYNPRRQVIGPPSLEVSILFDNSTLTSNISKYVKFQLSSKKLCSTICKK